jgi:transcriptional regulator with XRE-family HTH domain
MSDISNLRSLRQKAGLSLRELARRIDEQPTNVSFWERSGKLPRAELIVPIAQHLGVTVEELLGQPKPRKAQPAGGRLGELFNEITGMPRRKQQQIAAMLEDAVTAHKARTAG